MKYPNIKILFISFLLAGWLFYPGHVCIGQGISLSGNVQVKLKGSVHLVVRGAQGHISMDSECTLIDAAESTLKLSGDFVSDLSGISLAGNMIFDGTNAQTINAGTEPISVGNLAIDNAAGLTLQTPVLITGNITFTQGNIITSSTNLLTLESRTTFTAGSTNSFVAGPIGIKTLASAGDSYDFLFPTGKGDVYKPIHLKFDQTNTNVTTYQAALIIGAPPALTPVDPVTAVSSIHYWELSNGDTENFENAEIILPVSEDDGVSDINEVVIAKSEDNTTWNSLGGKEVTIPGMVTSENTFTTLGYFIIGSTEGTGGITFPAPPALPIAMKDIWLPVANPANPLPRDYQIIALPFTNQSVSTTLSDLGAQDDKKWKIFAYEENATQPWNAQDRARFAKASQFRPGTGYMFIYKEPQDINVSGTFVTPNNVSVILAPGFNLIGNPYWFPIDWEAVLTFNSGKPSIDQVASTLKIFQKGTGYQNATTLAPYKGAFVFNSDQNASVTLDIPASAICTGCGRYLSEKDRPKSSPLDADAWIVPLRLAGEDLVYELGGLGMTPEASESADVFDDFTVPRFLDYLEMNFHHPEFFVPKFTRDIVPTQEAYIWEFEVASNLHSPEVVLQWDNYYFGNNDRTLMLLDMHNHQIVNMREDTAYTFSPIDGSRRFKVFYGPEEIVQKNMLPDRIVIGEGYPNPMSTQFEIPVLLPESEQGYDVQLAIYSSAGQLVKILEWKDITPGYNAVGWHRENKGNMGVQPGLYLYRLTISGQTNAYSGKILVE